MLAICAGLSKQTTARIGPHKGRGTLLGTKNVVHTTWTRRITLF